jgi:Uma2 family endonuclease
MLTIEDLEKFQTAFPDHCMELEDGKIIVMSPSDVTSAVIGMRFGSRLSQWVESHQLGYVVDASGGFRLSQQTVKAPDVSFISKEKAPRLPRSFTEIVPDLVIEIKSATDRISSIRKKINYFLRSGSKIGILVDPDQHTVTLYRPTADPVIYQDGDSLTLPDLFPGWEISVSDLWPPIFEDL